MLRLQTEHSLFLIGAVLDQTACGVLAFTLEETIEIEYLMVSDAFLQRGTANAMLTFLCTYAAPELIPVYCTFAAEDKTDPLYLFFAEREDFTVEELEGARMAVTRRQIEEADQLKVIDCQGIAVVSFFDRPNRIQKAFLMELARQGIYYLEDDTVFQESVKPLCLTIGSGEKLKAAVFIGRGENEQEWTLSFAWCAPGCSRALIRLFAVLRRELLKEMPADGELIVDGVEPTSCAIIQKLFPNAAHRANYFEAVWDMDAVEKGVYETENDRT